MAERLVFDLIGRDRLSGVLDRVGLSAIRARRTVDDAARGMSDSVDESTRRATDSVERFTRDAAGRLRDSRGRFAAAGRDLGDDTGRETGRSLLSRITGSVRSGIGEAISDGLSGLRGSLGAIQSNPYVAAAGAAIAYGMVAALLPMAGALLSGAVIAAGGLSVIGLGAALLKDEPAVKEAASRLVGTAQRIFDAAAQPLAKPFTYALHRIEASLKGLKPLIDEAFLAVAPAIDPLVRGITDLVENALPGFVSMLKDGKPVFEAIGDALGEIGTGLGGMFRLIGQHSEEAGTAIRDIGKAIKWTLIATGAAVGLLVDQYIAVRDFAKKVYKAFQWLYDVLVGHSIVPDLINRIIQLFTGLPGRAAKALSSLGSKLVEKVTSAGSRMVSAIRSKIDSAVSAVRGLPGRAASALSGIGSRLYNSGRSLIQGFISGMRSMIGSVRSASSSVASAAREYFPFSPAKKGPFAGRGYTLYSGRSLVDGFAAGVLQRRGHAVRAIASVAGSASRAMPADLGGAAAGGGRAMVASPRREVAPVTITVNGALDPVAVGQQIRKQLLELKRVYGVNFNLGVS